LGGISEEEEEEKRCNKFTFSKNVFCCVFLTLLLITQSVLTLKGILCLALVCWLVGLT
jgi:hypothetical protein